MGLQHMEQLNIEPLTFLNFEYLNIEKWIIRFFIFEFIFNFYICLNYLNTQNIW